MSEFTLSEIFEKFEDDAIEYLEVDFDDITIDTCHSFNNECIPEF